MDIEPTKEEQNAINTLKRLAKRWPESLWLFSANGTLCVMRAGENGEQITTDYHSGGTGPGSGGGVDQDYIITTIDIPNDGGDW